MSQEIVKFDVNNTIPLQNSSDVKEEIQDEYYRDNKICVSETTININNTDLNECINNEKIRKYETLSLDCIKTDLRSSEVSDTKSDVKIENGICSADIQIKFSNELLFCSRCQEVYQDYCTKCRVLVHILNKRPAHNTYNRVRELPTDMLETKESFGHLGIFSLKVIPENVRFGPFTGLNSTGLPLRIKGGRFVVSDDKSELLNWMQHINPAQNNYEQNLFPFQYEDKLYYCSTRRIQEGEELLVYFGEEYEDNLLKNVEMDFVPITKQHIENVFACTFCCLGFNSKEYLAEHKAVCQSGTEEIFYVEDVVQCPFCKIYLEAKEYFEHHVDYCRETNDRYCILPTPEVHEVEVERRSSLRNMAQRRKCGIYKCTQCKFRTMYNADFRQHTNEHYRVKMFKCGICDRRYNAKESLKAHVVKIHIDNESRDVQKRSSCDYFKANIKNVNERRPHSHDGEKQCQSLKCKLQTRDKYHLKSPRKIKYMNRGKYKCASCEFKTYYRVYLERHVKINHLRTNNNSECEFETSYMSSYRTFLEMHTKVKHMECNYKCTECEFKTNSQSCLQEHINAKHLKEHTSKSTECEFNTNYKSHLENNYKCTECEFKTNYKSTLYGHVQGKHRKENSYKCMECEYNTHRKAYLKGHIKSVHLRQKDYKCMECEFKANTKSHLQTHIKARHLGEKTKCVKCEFRTCYKASLIKHMKSKHTKQYDYNCIECEFKTNYKSHLQLHIKAKHRNEYDYKCTECEYETNFKRCRIEHINSKHLKQNDYKCTECEYNTSRKPDLQRHIKAIHRNEYDYKCTECEYETNFKRCLIEHINSKHLKQNYYECKECEYKTNYKTNFERHIKTKHLKQTDYKCTECEYKTNYKSSLQAHIKAKHRNEYDYKCTECEFQTNFKRSLIKHIKAKHLKQTDYK